MKLDEITEDQQSQVETKTAWHAIRVDATLSELETSSERLTMIRVTWMLGRIQRAIRYQAV